MATKEADTQAVANISEPLNESATVRLTASEKADVLLLKLHGIRPTESDVLRDLTMLAIRAEASRIRQAVASADERASA